MELGAVLEALSDPVRLDVVRQLAEAGGTVLGGFDVRVTDQTLSYHLRALTDAGLVRVTQTGRYRRCELRLAEVDQRFPGLLPAVLVNAGASLPHTVAG